jgi:hypothetical protein
MTVISGATNWDRTGRVELCASFCGRGLWERVKKKMKSFRFRSYEDFCFGDGLNGCAVWRKWRIDTHLVAKYLEFW